MRPSAPTVVQVSPLSFRIRASTGNAVIAIAVATNRENGSSATPDGASVGCNHGAIAKPSTNGSSIAIPPTRNEADTCARSPAGMRSSAPTMNMNSTSPIWLMPASAGRLCWRKQLRVQTRRDLSEQHRPESEASDHFADHGRLADTAQQQRQHACSRQDDDELQQQHRVTHDQALSATPADSGGMRTRAPSGSMSSIGVVRATR